MDIRQPQPPVGDDLSRRGEDYLFLQPRRSSAWKGHGYKSYGYDYVSKIGYNKFEQRTYLKYCNGAETFYTYDPQRRRLQNLTVNSGGNTIMDNAYTYDANSKYINKKNKHSHQKKLQPSHKNLFVQPLQYLTVGQKTSLIEI